MRSRLLLIVAFACLLSFLFFISSPYFLSQSNSYGLSIKRQHFDKDKNFHDEKCTSQPENIAVLVVVDKPSYLKDFSLAQKTLACYCTAQNYSLNYIFLKDDTSYTSKCNQANLFLQRHCVTVEFMRLHPCFKWVLFVDADIGVINPRNRIEEFIHERTDAEIELILCERLITWEIMAGSYLAKNTPFAHNFLMEWANYASNKNYHQDDQGPLHQVLISRYAPLSPNKLACDKLYNSTNTYGTYLNEYVTCARHILDISARTFASKIKLIRRGDSWVRDGHKPVTSSWANRDFMFHNWKDKSNSWTFPFLDKNSSTAFKLENCRVTSSRSKEDVFKSNWNYKIELKKTDKEVEEIVAKVRHTSHIKYLNALNKLKVLPDKETEKTIVKY